MPEEKDKKGPIKVTDRRAFTLDGERRAPDAESPASSTPPEPPSPPRPASEPAPGAVPGAVMGEGFELRHGPGQTAERPLPPVEFSDFIVSLASTAFIQLGEVEDPVTGKIEIHLEGARQMIDILTMLRDRTRGNLDAREEEFLEGVLYELKMKFAAKASQR